MNRKSSSFKGKKCHMRKEAFKEFMDEYITDTGKKVHEVYDDLMEVLAVGKETLKNWRENGLPSQGIIERKNGKQESDLFVLANFFGKKIEDFIIFDEKVEKNNEIEENDDFTFSEYKKEMASEFGIVINDKDMEAKELLKGFGMSEEELIKMGYKSDEQFFKEMEEKLNNVI